MRPSMRCRAGSGSSIATIAAAITRTLVGSMPRCSKECSKRRSDVLREAPVKLGPTVAEEAERGAMFLGLREIELRHQYTRFLGAELREHVPTFVADEAVT